MRGSEGVAHSFFHACRLVAIIGRDARPFSSVSPASGALSSVVPHLHLHAMGKEKRKKREIIINDSSS